MIKHPMVRKLSGVLLLTYLVGNVTIVAASQTPTVSAESNSENEQIETDIDSAHSFAGANKILYDTINESTEKDAKINIKEGKETKEEKLTFSKKGYTTTAVNIRKKPNKKSKKLDTYTINTKIKYEPYNDKWIQIEYKKGSAFMAKKYISKKKTKIKTKVTYEYSGRKLTARAGTVDGPSGKETFYNMNMSGVIKLMDSLGISHGKYWIRSDGCKMVGDYIMVAANLKVHPRGSLVPTSLGMGMVCDTGDFALSNANQLDIATTW